MGTAVNGRATRSALYDIFLTLHNEASVFEMAQDFLDDLQGKGVEGTLNVSFDGKHGTLESQLFGLRKLPELVELQRQAEKKHTRGFCLLGEIKLGLESILRSGSRNKKRLLVFIDPSGSLEEAACRDELADLAKRIDQPDHDFKLVIVTAGDNTGPVLMHLRSQSPILPRDTFFRTRQQIMQLLFD